MFDLQKIISSKAFHEPFIVVLRHAEKVVDGRPSVYDCALTEEGVLQSNRFGALLNDKALVLDRIKMSPVPRCLKTAKILQEKTACRRLEESSLLGHPGAYIEDEQLAGKVFEENSIFDIVSQSISGRRFPGFRDLAEGHRLLLQEMRADLRSQKNSLYVSHDVILASFLGGLLKLPISKDFWIDYLHGFVVTLSNDHDILLHCQNKEFKVNA